MIFTVLVVAGFGIYNILNMTVTQKRQDIAILRSMGCDTFDIVILFFSQGLMIGVCGAFAGIVCGYFLCLYRQTIPFSGGPSASVAPRSTGLLHISLSLPIYFQAVALALITSSAASILPALSAGKAHAHRRHSARRVGNEHSNHPSHEVDREPAIGNSERHINRY